MGNMDQTWMKASRITEECENGVEDFFQFTERNAPSLRGIFFVHVLTVPMGDTNL